MATQALELLVPMGRLGLTGSENLSALAPGQLIEAESVTYENDVLQKDGGALRYTATPLGSPILGGWDWWPTPALQRMIVITEDGRLLRDEGAGTFPVTLATGLNPSVPVFIECGAEAAARPRLLVCLPGRSDPQVLVGDATTATPLTGPATEWAGAPPITGCVHDRRLWLAGSAAAAHRLYYSSATDHQDFAGLEAGSLPVFSGEGDGIVALASFNGILVAWKRPKGVYVADTRNVDPAGWQVSRVSGALGAANQQALVPTDTDIAFVNIDGQIYLLSTVQEFGSVAPRSVLQLLGLAPWLREHTNGQASGAIRAAYYAAKREAHFVYAGRGETRGTLRLMIDQQTPTPRPRVSLRDVQMALWMRQDAERVDRPVIGDDGGHVWLLDQPDRTKAGAAYEASWELGPLDFSTVDPTLRGRRKNGVYIEVAQEPVGSWGLTLEVRWDGQLVDTITFGQENTGSVLGSFTLGQSRLAASALVHQRRLGSGRQLSLRGSNARAGESFALSHLLVGVTPGDHRRARSA
jgi:hypothetical protein